MYLLLNNFISEQIKKRKKKAVLFFYFAEAITKNCFACNSHSDYTDL